MFCPTRPQVLSLTTAEIADRKERTSLVQQFWPNGAVCVCCQKWMIKTNSLTVIVAEHSRWVWSTDSETSAMGPHCLLLIAVWMTPSAECSELPTWFTHITEVQPWASSVGSPWELKCRVLSPAPDLLNLTCILTRSHISMCPLTF